MAVTITVAELLAALRLGSSDEETAQAARLLSYASVAIDRHSPGAPSTAQNEAAIRLAGFLFDQPFSARGPVFANAGRNSGAWAILLPCGFTGPGSVEGAIEAAQQAVGTTGNPVTNVEVSGTTLTVTFADGETRTEELPEGDDGAPDVDQTAGTRRRRLRQQRTHRTLTRRPGTRRRRLRQQRTRRAVLLAR